MDEKQVVLIDFSDKDNLLVHVGSNIDQDLFHYVLIMMLDGSIDEFKVKTGLKSIEGGLS